MGDVHDFRKGRRGFGAGPRAWGLMVLGGVTLGLGGAGLWSVFGPGAEPAAAPVEARDPWATSREQQRILEAQEAAPPNWFEGAEDAAGEQVSARFGFCHEGGGRNCVVDGDTFRFGGERVRIADIDTPETHPARCAEEAQVGARATARLHALLNAGPFVLERVEHDADRYGRKLRIVTRGGESIGGMLVNEGLARRYGGGPRAGWC